MKFFFFLILVLIAGCKSQAKEELTIYSIQLIKKDRYNVSIRSDTYFANGRILLPSPAKNQC